MLSAMVIQSKLTYLLLYYFYIFILNVLWCPREQAIETSEEVAHEGAKVVLVIHEGKEN